jgi:hypothetical protein
LATAYVFGIAARISVVYGEMLLTDLLLFATSVFVFLAALFIYKRVKASAMHW